MRRVLLVDAPVDTSAISAADDLGAGEIVYCHDGVPPPMLAGLAMGYHEIDEPIDILPPTTED